MHPLYPSPRVSQLDAHILDGELFGLLKQQLAEAFQPLSGKAWSYSQQPELWSLLLKLLLFKLTVAKSGSSYGLKLQNLKLTNSQTGKVIGKRTKLLFLGIIFGEYFFQKIQSFLYATETESFVNAKTLWEKIKTSVVSRRANLLKFVDNTVKLMKLANFVAFIVYGRFPTLLYRVLGVIPTPIVADLLKFNGDNVNFEFQNRQLVWNVMTEFLVFILPLLQLNKVKKAFKRLVASTTNKRNSSALVDLKSKYSELPESQCAICCEEREATGTKVASTEVTNPFVTNCGHIFCYICIATRFNYIENDVEGAELCPRCFTKLTSFEQYGNNEYDVDTSAIVVSYESDNGNDSSDVATDEKQLEDANQNPSPASEADDTEDFSDEEDLEEDSIDEDEDEDDYDDDDVGDDLNE
ncbi:putative peroxisomal biogenesis factor [Clavispora lusitaniae]|uniref:Peroxisomal biogenesis factor n=1 Tax=Clavispora lusitaniae TaxID=36911 RepID=A0ACD0WRL1_CLALS|nr:putative peroxisomal biogenesis factor [Clavispora lusitaniae]QFZ35862.1 putative peroxisomal biogenesis factor [Clavispora lusitaniae]QFZ41544.1 putative peroxisomal biogenesis factor [Clavispora lusitaniae]QFZ47222.1 putative peroxisomal biogenesis factor [Clavispora lusitaniae]QFZ52899.1 putative peroxisomal biogenesis factor [Clavispora lusitaniae]